MSYDPNSETDVIHGYMSEMVTMPYRIHLKTSTVSYFIIYLIRKVSMTQAKCEVFKTFYKKKTTRLPLNTNI